MEYIQLCYILNVYLEIVYWKIYQKYTIWLKYFWSIMQSWITSSIVAFPCAIRAWGVLCTNLFSFWYLLSFLLNIYNVFFSLFMVLNLYPIRRNNIWHFVLDIYFVTVFIPVHLRQWNWFPEMCFWKFKTIKSFIVVSYANLSWENVLTVVKYYMTNIQEKFGLVYFCKKYSARNGI